MASPISRPSSSNISPPGSEHFDPVPGVCSIETWNATKDPFRAAPDPFIPVPWPFMLKPASQKLLDPFVSMEQRCQQILQKHGITSESTRPYSVRLHGHDTDLADLVLVLTQDVDTTTWKAAADEIYQLFEGHGYEREAIKVEVRNERRAAFYKTVGLENDECLDGMIASVRDATKEKVITLFGKDWSFVAYYMRVAIPNRSICKSTCIIGVKPGLRSRFSYAESELLSIMDCPQFPEIRVFDVLDLLRHSPL